MIHQLAWLAVACSLGIAGAAHADGLGGSVTLSSQQIERGVAKSGGHPSLAADVEWAHALGGYVGLGAATVDSDQYGGSHVELSPRAGWRGNFADHDAGHWGVGVTGHFFPGAAGQRPSALPPRPDATTTSAQDTQFATAELNFSLGWRDLTLSADRSLTGYYGIGQDSVQTNVQGQRITTRLADSTGSWHVGVNVHHDFGDRYSAWVGVGREAVRNFNALDYTDWSLGGSAKALGLTWVLEFTGTNADSTYWRVQRPSGQSRDVTGDHAVLSAAWAF